MHNARKVLALKQMKKTHKSTIIAAGNVVNKYIKKQHVPD